MELHQDTTVATWRVVAVDGADLPSAQQRDGPAMRLLNVGMTFDALFAPPPGEYELRLRAGDTTFFYRCRLIAG